MLDYTDQTPYHTTIPTIISVNNRNGYHFFNPSSMRSFYSRVHDAVYGGRVFVTSEKYNHNSPRFYTVREVRPNGSIQTVSWSDNTPARFDTLHEAHSYAKAYAKERYKKVGFANALSVKFVQQ